MLHVPNSCTDPCFNLALEEYFLKYAPVADDLVILWQNSPTVVIGRNQNAAAEINQPFIEERNIQVVRRLSGGGAVYHDLGNLNFTFITSLAAVGHNNFAHFTLPIIEALGALGVNAEFTGRNDLTIGEAKFSGNAQYIDRDRLLHHGTLLFDTDMAVLAQALSGSDAKYAKPAVASVRSRVTTLRQHLPSAVMFAEFEAALLKAIFANAGTPYQRYELTAADRQSIKTLAEKRYQDPVWTYGTLQPYNHSGKHKFTGGTVEVLLSVDHDIIRRCKIFGDFFATGDMDELAADLCGTVFTKDAVSNVMKPWLLTHPIHNIAPEELLSCFFPDFSPIP